MSHDTDKNKLGGTAPPLITASGSCAIPRCSATEAAVARVAVAVNPRKQRTPNFSRRTFEVRNNKITATIQTPPWKAFPTLNKKHYFHLPITITKWGHVWDWRLRAKMNFPSEMLPRLNEHCAHSNNISLTETDYI